MSYKPRACRMASSSSVPLDITLQYAEHKVTLETPCQYTGFPICRVRDTEEFEVECRVVESGSVHNFDGRSSAPATVYLSVQDGDMTTEEDSQTTTATSKQPNSQLDQTCDCAKMCSRDEAKSGTSLVAKELDAECQCHRHNSGGVHDLTLSMLLLATSTSLVWMFLLL